MLKSIKLRLIIYLALILLSACSDERDRPEIIEEENTTNAWIEKVMRQNYLWYDQIPEKSALNLNLQPKPFFESLLSDQDGVFRNGKHQYFSTIEQKGTATRATSGTTPSYGFEFATYATQNNRIYALVIYVLPGSPAEMAGLKRGDWISAIDNTDLSYNDREKLYAGNAALFTLMKYTPEHTSITFDRTIEIGPARIVEDTPFLYDTILEEGSRKIGYLVYNRFRSGPEGTDDVTYDDHLKSLFQNYKNRGVNEFILDLRYNGGGLISCAQLLASLLAPATALNNTFCILQYNDKQKETQKAYSFNNSLSVKAGNLNLSRLYVLTGEMTASASELVINGLIPYMKRENIILIGQQTVGKDVGSNTYEKEGIDWVMHPITVRLFNAKGEAEYTDGFTPDIPLYEFDFGQELFPFGDRQELLLNRAIAGITGQTDILRSDGERPAAAVTMKRIYNSLDRYRENGVQLPSHQ